MYGDVKDLILCRKDGSKDVGLNCVIVGKYC